MRRWNSEPPPSAGAAPTRTWPSSDGVLCHYARTADHSSNREPSRQGLAVTWTHWRGPGKLTFDPMTMVVKDGKNNHARRVHRTGDVCDPAYADDGILSTPADVIINVTASAKSLTVKLVEVCGWRET